MRVQTNLKILENLLPESYTTCRKQQVGNNSALNTFEALRLESMPYIYTASSERCITCRRTPGYSPPPKESTNLTHAAKMAAKKIVLNPESRIHPLESLSLCTPSLQTVGQDIQSLFSALHRRRRGGHY